MNSWLSLFIARLAAGERWRKATLAEKRYGAGVFFFIPVCFEVLILAMRNGKSFMVAMDTASAATLWLGFTVCASLLFFGAMFWGRHVSIKVSMVLAIVAWLALAATIVHYDFLWGLNGR